MNELETRSWEALARAALADAEPAHDPALQQQLLVFSVGDASYAVPVEYVREIVRFRPITPLPRTQEDVRGVISLRGEIIQVIDLRRRLSLPSAEPTRATRIVVVHTEDGRLAGLLVDAVREVLRAGMEEITQGLAVESGAVEALCARGGAFVSLVALDRVLDVDARR